MVDHLPQAMCQHRVVRLLGGVYPRSVVHRLADWRYFRRRAGCRPRRLGEYLASADFRTPVEH